MVGSFSHVTWIVLSALGGALFLIFDAIRYFAQQVSPVTLRRWSGDPAVEGGSRWLHFNPQNLQLVSGSLLQITLVGGFVAMIRVLDGESAAFAVGVSAAVWLVIVILWKFVLAFVPEDMGEMILKALIPFSHFFYYLFWPILFPLRRVFDRLDREEEEAHEDEEVTDEEVQAYIDVGEEEGILEASEGKMIQSVVDFSDRVARELMTPRIDVVAFDATHSLDELAKSFIESKYSRIPIYDGSVDKITGIVHIKEVFEAIVKGEQKAVAELARPPYFVSETKKVSELLREFQSEHIQVAVVVDEYGGTAGIVTIEDVVEEIVGEIADEHEEEEATIVDMGGGEYMVSGQLRVESLEELLDAGLESEDYETIAGLIFTSTGRVPKAGVVVKKNGYQFIVDRADRRRIYRVRVSKDPEWTIEDEDERESRG
ncbi:MAG: magnesium and cobalt exporter, family [Thermoanaerobaculia bacterium]|jgi:CBS domain containing-hemolysin-like protein|nr:magnesium and cobalt exporter, family [Thermoanaerobaculia bacterium]